MMQITPMVKQLLIINVIAYIGAQLVPQTYDLLALYYFENPNFQVWQLLTHMFMHASIKVSLMHILFNMLALYSFGSALEHLWGAKRFLFFYLSCGLGAALIHTGVNYFEFHAEADKLVQAGFNLPEIKELLNKDMFQQGWPEVIGQDGLRTMYSSYNGTVVGASGAIYGLFVAFAFMFPNAELMLLFLPIPIKAKYFVPGLLALDLFLGVSGQSIFGSSGPGIAHFAHLGGALVGFLMMWYWKKNQFNQNRWN